MKAQIATGFILVALLAPPIVEAQTDSHKQVSRVLKRYDLTPLSPPVIIDSQDTEIKNSWSPGYIFTIERFANGNKAASTVCYSVFGTNTAEVQWAHPEKQVTSKGSIGLAAGLLAEVAEVKKAEVSAGFEWSRNSLLSFDQLKLVTPRYGLTDKQYRSLGEGKSVTSNSISIDKDCADRIAQFLKERKKLYVVVQTVKASGITVSVDRSTGANLSANFDIGNYVSAKPSAKYERTSKESMKFIDLPNSIVLGTRVAEIKQSSRRGDVSATAGQVGRALKLEEAKLDEISHYSSSANGAGGG